MTRLVLRELPRWVRAVGAPLAALAIVVVTPHLVPDAAGTVLRLAPDSALSAAWMAALVASLVWVLTAGLRAALQPTHDRRAAVHLQSLREGAARHDARLLCVERPLWQSLAGQRVVASDVRDGRALEVWLSEAALPAGAFALVAMDREPGTLVDWISPRDLAAARRAERVEATRRRVRATQAADLAARRERKAAAAVVRAAEALLDRR